MKRFVKFKSKEELEKLATQTSGIMQQYYLNNQNDWCIWSDDAGQVVDLYGKGYMDFFHEQNMGASEIQKNIKLCLDGIQGGIDYELTKETHPEYYL